MGALDSEGVCVDTTVWRRDVIDARITPDGTMDVLSQLEVNRLCDTSTGGLYELFRACSLAVLNCGSDMDDGLALLEKYADFDIRVIQQHRGIKLEIKNAPNSAFVDGVMIKGIREHLFAVLRDIIYVHHKLDESVNNGTASSYEITNAIFHIVRNARLLRPRTDPHLVVCWGGTPSIGRSMTIPRRLDMN